MTGWADDFLFFTVGFRARDGLVGVPVARLCRTAEALRDEGTRREIEAELETVTFASLIVHAGDVGGDPGVEELTRDTVAVLHTWPPIQPLLVLDVPVASVAEWDPARLIYLSRALGAPVVRAVEPRELPAWELAALWWESFGPGITGIDGRDVEAMFGRDSGGVVFKWRPWNGDELGALPPLLLETLRGSFVVSVFVTYRFGATGTLHRIDAVVALIQSTVPEGADVLFASPTVEAAEDEVLVTVIHARRP